MYAQGAHCIYIGRILQGGGRVRVCTPEQGSMSLMLNYDLQQAIPSLDSIAGPGSFAFLDNLAVGLPKNV